LESKVDRKVVTVSFSLEVPVVDSDESVEELREKVQDSIAAWSRSRWSKMKKKERDRKRGVRHEV
jgi:hypothetical protein